MTAAGTPLPLHFPGLSAALQQGRSLAWEVERGSRQIIMHILASGMLLAIRLNKHRTWNTQSDIGPCDTSVPLSRIDCGQTTSMQTTLVPDNRQYACVHWFCAGSRLLYTVCQAALGDLDPRGSDRDASVGFHRASVARGCWYRLLDVHRDTHTVRW